MKILLDIDGVVLNADQIMHSRTRELIENNDVILYSANDQVGPYLSREFGIPFLLKDDKKVPEADVLIDDFAEWFVRDNLVKVDRFYHSIDEFFEVENE